MYTKPPKVGGRPRPQFTGAFIVPNLTMTFGVQNGVSLDPGPNGEYFEPPAMSSPFVLSPLQSDAWGVHVP